MAHDAFPKSHCQLSGIIVEFPGFGQKRLVLSFRHCALDQGLVNICLDLQSIIGAASVDRVLVCHICLNGNSQSIFRLSPIIAVSGIFCAAATCSCQHAETQHGGKNPQQLFFHNISSPFSYFTITGFHRKLPFLLPPLKPVIADDFFHILFCLPGAVVRTISERYHRYDPRRCRNMQQIFDRIFSKCTDDTRI